MAYNFPDNPTINQVFGNYTWDGTKWVQTSGGSGGGGPVLLATLTGANSLTLGTALPAGYSLFQIDVVGLVPAATNVQLLAQISTNSGSSFIATGYGGAQINFTGSALSQTSNPATGFSFGAANLAPTIPVFARASIAKLAGGTGFLGNSTPLYGVNYGNVLSAWIATAGANFVQFLFSSGNITSGTIKVYGIP